ncbi:RNase adapter RapZ [Adlercreutzia sp. ZJ473]|uniref:RNase adapter RapZ n=1 Tax=Adlercreutzia sp. ZJ473 TaxID=2722822 RepID=UPI001C12EE45|nr:RNase adapter RapZ [Adlercreutzia sp. ZJ473]
MTEEHVDLENMPDLVIVTGMSGAGRTEAMHVFEDLGYFCVDNLPASLIGNLIELNERPGGEGERKRLAVVCDARNGGYFGSLDAQLGRLREEGVDYRMLFLDADDEKLVARYKSSRRRHPLCTDGTTIAQGIQRERQLLMDLHDASDHVINTTEMLPQKLRTTIRSLFGTGSERRGLAVTVYSFGFKHGAPLDADLVMDVRFLPNPYYDPELRPLTGLDAPVRDFVMLREETIEFRHRWHDLLDVVMPGYVAEGKQQLAIAVGCTGGQHRSVALAESTGDYLKTKGYRVSVAHRDLKLADRHVGAAVLAESPDVRAEADAAVGGVPAPAPAAAEAATGSATASEAAPAATPAPAGAR